MRDLSSDSIAAEALAIVDDQGVSGFTIRAVAERLGVTPMALYHHVPDKAALAALMINVAISEMPMAPSTGVWRDDLWEMARWMRDSTIAHPALTHLRRAHRVWTPAMLSMTERWLSLWQQSGLAPKDAVLAATTSSLAIAGLVAEESLVREMEIPDGAMLSMLPGAQTVFSSRLDPDVVFELAVRSLIDGLHAQLRDGLRKTSSAKRMKPARPARNGKSAPAQRKRHRA